MAEERVAKRLHAVMSSLTVFQAAYGIKDYGLTFSLEAN